MKTLLLALAPLVPDATLAQTDPLPSWRDGARMGVIATRLRGTKMIRPSLAPTPMLIAVCVLAAGPALAQSKKELARSWPTRLRP